jgi:hypothetical protein
VTADSLTSLAAKLGMRKLMVLTSCARFVERHLRDDGLFSRRDDDRGYVWLEAE